MPTLAEEPAAPPPSPVLGARPTAREALFSTAKRKVRDEPLPSTLLHVESELDAMRLEARPSKFVRMCASS